jgi:hypothetical protein
MFKNKFNLRIVVAIAICLAGVFTTVSCSGIFGNSNSPKGVVEQSYDALKAKDYAKVVSFMHDGKSDEVQLAKDREQAAGMMEKMTKWVGELVSYSIGEEKIAADGNSAVVIIELEFSKNGKQEKQRQEVKTIKIDGKWWITQ